MPPKKATTGATTKKTASGHASYRDMIKDAIINLKERNGSSRQQIKKYVQANNTITVASPAAFDSQFNKAIKAGVEKGEFSQPKGPSGPVKLAKKAPAAKPAAKKPSAASKTGAAKKTSTAKKPAAKPAAKKAAGTTTTTKKTTAKPKANTAKPRKTSSSAPAVVSQPKVETVTKSGRVTKTAPKPAAKKAAPKKKAAAPKKA